MKPKRSLKSFIMSLGMIFCLLGNHDRAFAESGINVYPPVPGLPASEYYSFSVQEVSNLDVSDLAHASNWLEPFAWFTKCIDRVDGAKSAYFEEFMGSWSHTYCNFELAHDTPIVVKISRLEKPGAPSGPIVAAVARPARSVESCEIIDGDVYVTMNNPALVVIDIDGQMETRRAPLNIEPQKWGDRDIHSPFANEMDATHAVTIFANPFLEDKPDPSDDGVKLVHPGDSMPVDDGSWSTLYFMPGIHKMSVDASGNEREWRPEDVYKINSDRSYYIPGDAIVYGNFHDKDWLGVTQENVRLFGHGTLSGTKIAHWNDWSEELKQIDPDHSLLRVYQIASAKNCVVEGITVADQAEHGIYYYAANEDYKPNYIKWVKMISWRVNNDGMHANGNSYIEDCFIRHQDDALYVDGMAIRRVLLWSDVNGAPLRGTFLLKSRKGNYPSSLPQDLIVEDIDVIYTRSYWGGAVITPAGPFPSETYSDGTENVGQHLIFRNLTVSDPLPQRVLFGFDLTESEHANFSGLRFQNVNFEAANSYGYPIELLGSDTSKIGDWRMDNVTIDGETVDQNYLDDPKKTITNEYVSNFQFGALALSRPYTPPSSSDPTGVTKAVSFSEESDPGTDWIVRDMGTKVGYISPGSWIAFQDFDFGTGVSSCTLWAASETGDQTVELRLDSPSGELIGTVKIENTEDFNHFKAFTATIRGNPKGKRKLFLVFSGGFDVESFTMD